MLTVNLAPEVENQVIQKAAELGQDTDQYLGRLVYEALRQPVPDVIRSTLAPMERAYAFRRWAADPPYQLGP